MREVIEDVLLHQANWTSKNTPEMAERGIRIRHDGPNWLRSRQTQLEAAAGVLDIRVEGRDGTGPKSIIPWFRFFSQSRSPSATVGWYVVLLFAADGSSAFMSLNQGTTTWTGEAFEPKPARDLAERVLWARQVIAERTRSTERLVPDIDLRSDRQLAAAYERGNVFANEYSLDEVPSDADLERDALAMARLLGELYRAEECGQVPGDTATEIVAAIEDANRSAGRPTSDRRTGFRISKDERDLIEKHAMSLAESHYLAQGWRVRDVSRRESCDFRIVRDGQEVYVEVKGTTSLGSQVILTRAEVDLHRRNYPNNALIVVYSIVLDRTTRPTSVRGGELLEWRPWEVNDEQLTPISFFYQTGL